MKVDSGSSSVSSGGGGGSAVKNSPAESKADSKPAAGASETTGGADTSPAGDTTPASDTSPTAGTDPTDTVDVAGKPEETNPYSDIAPYSETVTAEQWTRDRTPGEGQVSRDDHLIGMLENRGFSQEEIYTKDANGQTLFERVASQNNLDDPNLIQAGGSYEIPSRNMPEGATQEASATAVAGGLEDAYADAVSTLDVDKVKGEIASNSADATAVAEHGDATANADANMNVGEAVDAKVKNAADASATSVTGDAEANASADTVVGSADNSTVETTAAADAASVTGDAAATAEADTRVGEAQGSTIVTGADAQAASVTGDADANASAVTDVGTLQDSNVISDANAVAETVTGTPSAVAESEVNADAVSGATIDSGATAQGVTAGEPVTASANTEVAVDAADGVGVSDRSEVAADGSTAVDQSVAVVGNQGDLQVDVAGQGGGTGPVNQDVQFDGNGTADVRLDASGGEAEQTVINHGATEGTSATVVSDGGVAPGQTIEGVETAHQQIDNAQVAVLGNDAQKATYVAEGNEIVSGYHEGKDGTVDISAEASERVFFRDGSMHDLYSTNPTGNDVVGNIDTNNANLQFPNSNSFNGTLNGTGDGVEHRVDLPTNGNGSNTVVANQGSGDSFLGVTGTDPNMLATKTDGAMQMYVDSAGGNNNTLAFDMGQAALTGQVDLSKNTDSNVHIRTGGADHDIDFTGGSGNNDTMFVHLNGDDPAPRVVLDEGSSGFLGIGGRDEVAVGSGDTQGVIRAPGFDNVVFLRDGEVVDHYGQLPEGYQSFDQVAEGLKQNTPTLPNLSAF